MSFLRSYVNYVSFPLLNVFAWKEQGLISFWMFSGSGVSYFQYYDENKYIQVSV